MHVIWGRDTDKKYFFGARIWWRCRKCRSFQ